MKERFFQGEDILVELQFFPDPAVAAPLVLTGKEIDLLCYTRLGGFEFEASTAEGADYPVERVGTDRMRVTIPGSESVNFEPGMLNVEMRVRDTTVQPAKTYISAGPVIGIEPSRIGRR